MTDKYEYVGEAEFPSCGVTPRFTEEEWHQRATGEFHLTRLAAGILDMDDRQLEEYARTLGTTDDEAGHAFMDLADWIGEWRHRYQDSAAALETVTARMRR